MLPLAITLITLFLAGFAIFGIVIALHYNNVWISGIHTVAWLIMATLMIGMLPQYMDRETQSCLITTFVNC